MATRVAYPAWNSEYAIRPMIDKAFENEVSLLVFPELCISGYSCGDLFGQTHLLKKCEEEVAAITEY